MNKTFPLTHSKIKPARLADSIKHDIKKYLKKERVKDLEDGMRFWEFDVSTGTTSDDALPIHIGEINTYIDSAVERGAESIYFSITKRSNTREGWSQ